MSGVWIGCGAIIKESLLREDYCRLNPQHDLRRRTRQTSGEAGARGVSGGSETEKLSYVTLNKMSTCRFCSKPDHETQTELFTALLSADCRPNKSDSGHPHGKPPTYFQAISISNGINGAGLGVLVGQKVCLMVVGETHSLGAPMTQEALSGMRSAPNSVDPFCLTFVSKAVCF